MTDASEHLDLDTLKELKVIMGDEYSLLLETFINDSVVRIKTIAQAVAAQDPDAICRTAHSLKGSAGNMGAVRLSHICKALEELGASGSVQGASVLLEDMQNEYQLVSLALSES
jgi:HPt (histidine-containing phosphotransfer) domain-containing protein